MTGKVAIYLRVSTADQTTANQRPECEAVAARRGQLVRVYEETESARKVRPVFDEMLRDARRASFDILIIWALDRFGRTMAGNIADVSELDRLGVSVVSVRESWLDTAGPARGLLIAIFSWVAEQELARLRERIRAGLDRARREGKHLGRRHRRFDLDEALACRAGGLSYAATAERLGVPVGVLFRALKIHAGHSKKALGEGPEKPA